MKAVILAAGQGVRMRPLTEVVPKVLVEVNKKPFLSYVLNNLKEAGFTDIGIVVGYKEEKVKEFLKKEGIKVTLIEQSEQLGTGHAVLQAKKFCGQEQFIVLGGDNLFGVGDLKKIQVKDDSCYVLGKVLEETKKYGVLITEDDKLVRIIEKPQDFGSAMINTGLYKFTVDIWAALENINQSERGEYELTDALTLLALEGKVKVLKLEDYWLDLGCKEDVEKVEGLISQQHL
jgi:dTDP-glucose pyrophosphorylase